MDQSKDGPELPRHLFSPRTIRKNIKDREVIVYSFLDSAVRVGCGSQVKVDAGCRYPTRSGQARVILLRVGSDIPNGAISEPPKHSRTVSDKIPARASDVGYLELVLGGSKMVRVV